MTSFARAGVLLGVLALAACGSEATLQALQVSPAVTQVTEHLRADLTVTAVWDDGGRRDVTAEATWTSEDAAVASVEGGHLQAGQVGGTYLTAAWGGLQASARVEVVPAELLSLRLVAEETAVPAGLTTHVVALGIFSDGSERDVTGLVTWSDDHDDDDPVSVDLEGHCHCEVEAAVTLRATLGEISAELALRVTAAAPVALALAGLEASLPVGVHAHLSVFALLTDGTTREVTGLAELTVADPTVGLLGADHALLALRVGATEVRAAYQGLTAAATLQATAAVLESLTLRPSDEDAEPGQLVYFTATGRFSDGATRDLTRAVAWSTSDAVVAISYPFIQPGCVLARAVGRATVTALDTASGVAGTYLLVVERDD